MTNYWAETSVADIDTLCRDTIADRQANMTHPRGALGVLGRLTALFAGWQGVTTPHCKAVTRKNFYHCERQKSAPGFSNKSENDAVQFVPTTRGSSTSAPQENNISPSVSSAPFAVAECIYVNSPFIPSCQPNNNVRQSIFIGRQQIFPTGADLFVANSLEENDHTIALHVLRNFQPSTLEKQSSTETGTQLLSDWGSPTIAAMTGAYIRSAQSGVPILVNSTVATAAALAAIRFNKGVSSWVIFSHTSDNFFHNDFISAIGAETVLESTEPGLDNNHTELAIDIISSTLTVHARMMSSNQPSSFAQQTSRHVN